MKVWSCFSVQCKLSGSSCCVPSGPAGGSTVTQFSLWLHHLSRSHLPELHLVYSLSAEQDSVFQWLDIYHITTVFVLLLNVTNDCVHVFSCVFM